MVFRSPSMAPQKAPRWLLRLSGLWMVTLSLSAVAAPSLPERALELHDEARALYAEGKYHDAISKLRRAVAADPKGKMLFYNLGLIQEKLGKLDAALEDYGKCLELEHDAAERERLGAIIDRISGARLDAQMHRERDKRAAPPPPVPPAEPHIHVNPWVWVSASSAAASVFVGGMLAARAAALDPGSEASTSASTSVADLQADADAAHSHAIGADVAFGIAGASAVAAVVLAITTTTTTSDRSAGQRSRPVRAGWSLQLDRAALQLRF